MHLLFLDESGQLDQGGLFALGGIAVRDRTGRISRRADTIEGLVLGPNHYSIGLQCADFVVAVTAAAERGVGQGSGYLKKLLPRFAHHPATGELGGGLKRFPEREPRTREAHHLF